MKTSIKRAVSIFGIIFILYVGSGLIVFVLLTEEGKPMIPSEYKFYEFPMVGIDEERGILEHLYNPLCIAIFEPLGYITYGRFKELARESYPPRTQARFVLSNSFNPEIESHRGMLNEVLEFSVKGKRHGVFGDMYDEIDIVYMKYGE